MKPSRLIDISRTISSGSVVFPGDSPLKMDKVCEIGPSCPCSITQLGWTTHFLTHVDPPCHFIQGGKTLDDISIDRFCGEALVISVTGDAIAADDLPNGRLDGVSLLFKTRNSRLGDTDDFDANHVYLTKEAAEKAVAAGVNLVGIDYLSVDHFGDETYPTHRTLLGNNVLILEGVNLAPVSPGRYTLFALPLKIQQGDGSPVRAILMPHE